MSVSTPPQKNKRGGGCNPSPVDSPHKKRSPFCWEDSPCVDKDHHTGDFIGPSWKGVAQSNPIHINRHAGQSQSLLLTWTSRATHRPAWASKAIHSVSAAAGEHQKLLLFSTTGWPETQCAECHSVKNVDLQSRLEGYNHENVILQQQYDKKQQPERLYFERNPTKQ